MEDRWEGGLFLGGVGRPPVSPYNLSLEWEEKGVWIDLTQEGGALGHTLL